ncbi:hypothetical protein F4821DRAFT_238893 [Hypoxylon rubiginosum]|uniref:Uncharacterized protein n=1 Tax=Hypoxylon rubiginosum TaxID=110542 RepID=A0ACC0D0P2_9PEZI|nr:hypothetical protein F4821DRAFT_238893 [Hypoxylon rubiginosum]
MPHIVRSLAWLAFLIAHDRYKLSSLIRRVEARFFITEQTRATPTSSSLPLPLPHNLTLVHGYLATFTWLSRCMPCHMLGCNSLAMAAMAKHVKDFQISEP